MTLIHTTSHVKSACQACITGRGCNQLKPALIKPRNSDKIARAGINELLDAESFIFLLCSSSSGVFSLPVILSGVSASSLSSLLAPGLPLLLTSLLSSLLGFRLRLLSLLPRRGLLLPPPLALLPSRRRDPLPPSPLPRSSLPRRPLFLRSNPVTDPLGALASLRRLCSLANLRARVIKKYYS